MLAQQWLYGDRVSSPYDGYLQSRLELPDKFNPHSTVAILNKLAERIVFTDDVPTILYDMYENKQLTFAGMLSSARLPYDCFWIEYNSVTGLGEAADEISHASYGALVQRINADQVRMIIVTGLHYHNADGPISTITHVIVFDEWPPTLDLKEHGKTLAFSVAYSFNNERIRSGAKSALQDLGAIVIELIFGIFLVTQPRCYTDEQVKWKSSHAAKRAKANKPPLLEYRKIRLHICKPRKHYEHRPASGRSADYTALRDIEDDASIQHRRYHKVMGHFRHYVRTNPPRSVWIEAHYRGDPKLGVTFTERDVTR